MFRDIVSKAMVLQDPPVSDAGCLRLRWRSDLPGTRQGVTLDGRPIWATQVTGGVTVYKYHDGSDL